MKVCLVIIYNHRFEKNISKLNEYYNGRFDNIFHVIPFYKSSEENVITVYENSHQFNGYIAQAYPFFYRDDFTHYIFVGDDLILNPTVNQENFAQKINLSENSSYIKKLYALHEVSIPWYHIPKLLYRFVSQQGVEAMRELPNISEATEIARKHHVEIKRIKLLNFLKHIFIQKTPLSFFRTFAYSVGYAYVKRFKNLLQPPYALVVAYSDFLVVPKQSINDFSKYCGVFAGMNLFVESAIPTALLLASDKIDTENQNFKGVELWDVRKVNNLKRDNNSSIKTLFENNPNKLYFHPVKLSAWKIE